MKSLFQDATFIPSNLLSIIYTAMFIFRIDQIETFISLNGRNQVLKNFLRHVAVELGAWIISGVFIISVVLLAEKLP